MLKIGKLTDYALLILSEMAKTPDAVLSATIIAERVRLPLPTVSKVLKMLAERALVSSVRGAEGGYHLVKSAEEISIADVVSAMEGGLAITECCESRDLCAVDASCGLSKNWQKINKMVYGLLANVSILDMQKPLPGDMKHE